MEVVRAKVRVWSEIVERRAPGVALVFGYSLLAADRGFLTRSGMTNAMLWRPWRELPLMELIGSRHILNFYLPFLKSCVGFGNLLT